MSLCKDRSCKIEREAASTCNAYGLSNTHLLRKAGAVTKYRQIPKLTEDQSKRFWSRVVKTDTCWLWNGCCHENGYGVVKFNKKTYWVHRVAYTICVGPIPDGLVLDHVKNWGCANRNCLNPSHLEPVTNEVNILRGTGFNLNREKTHCPKGHEYSPENTYLSPRNIRHCRICGRSATRTYMRRIRASTAVARSAVQS